MSILGSTFGRALAGVGEAGASIAQKYIDDEILRNRAQAMADIQRNSAVQQTKDIDAYQNDPTRRDALRGEATKDQEATEAARLRGDINRATNSELTEAETKRAAALAKASAQAAADVNRDATLKNGGDPEYIKALTKIAQAGRDPSAVAAHAAQTALAQFQLASAKKVADLQDELTSAISSGDQKAEEQARLKLDAIQGKGGKADKFYAVAENAGKAMAPALKVLADPAADPAAKEEAQQTIREQRALMTAAAKRAGVDLTEASKGSAPYEEGQEIRGKTDGKIYIVKDGVPVLKGQQSAAPAAAPSPRAAPASTLPSVQTGDAVLNSMGAENEQKLAGVEQQYRAAKAELQSAISSGGNPQAQIAAAQKLQGIRNSYTQLANSLFGNNAQRYVDKLNSI